MRNWKLFSYYSAKTYVVGTQKNRLIEMVLWSTPNTCFNWWIRKIIAILRWFFCLTGPMTLVLAMQYTCINCNKPSSCKKFLYWKYGLLIGSAEYIQMHFRLVFIMETKITILVQLVADPGGFARTPSRPPFLNILKYFGLNETKLFYFHGIFKNK